MVILKLTSVKQEGMVYELPGSIKEGNFLIGSRPIKFSNSASWGYLVNYSLDKGRKPADSRRFP
jgi:hypothetical protein